MATPTGNSLQRLDQDPYLRPYLASIRRRHEKVEHTLHRLTQGQVGLETFANAHEFFGLHRKGGLSPAAAGAKEDGWVFRERAPHATAIFLVGEFSGWDELPAYALHRKGDDGTWEIHLPKDTLRHGMLYRLRMHWKGGSGDRIPSHARRVVQDAATLIFNAQVWCPEKPYQWRRPAYRRRPVAPLIYETHVGMAQETAGIGTYRQFMENILPRIADAGYNTIQLMAVMEHPYYGSFGYQVSNFFAASSRFGTPEELKELVDAAHSFGLAVIMDIVHSHAVQNEVEGLSRFDGSTTLYFHGGSRGHHIAWDSRCFNYGKTETLHFLLSNCRFWLDEYHFDGFRFDGITSMLYHHHGLGPAFDSYERYFDDSVDEDALVYATLANRLIHSVRPDAVTIAEDVSGMPGLAAPFEQGGCGFDYRMAMGVPDLWFKLLKDVPDENWPMGGVWHELNNRRPDEQAISYVECHDQALVGSKTAAFELMDAAMYDFMRVSDSNVIIDRGMALHKMLRLATLSSAAHGYLNFMGNEFGHPEWIDFPREGNKWSYHYARRQWSLRDNQQLKYRFLAEFDKGLMALAGKQELLDRTSPSLLQINDNDKVLAFGRSGLFLFFNFHPSRSLTDYRVEVLPGEYELVLDTDEIRFGGHGRVEPGQHYFTMAIRADNVLQHCLQLYLPCRCGLVLRRMPRTPAVSKQR